MNEVEEIIRATLSRYSYHASEICIASIAGKIEAHYAEAVEKAWQYDELCD